MDEWRDRRAPLRDRAEQLRDNSATYADRRRRAGWRRVAMWVPEDRVAELRAIVAGMCSIDEDRAR